MVCTKRFALPSRPAMPSSSRPNSTRPKPSDNREGEAGPLGRPPPCGSLASGVGVPRCVDNGVVRPAAAKWTDGPRPREDERGDRRCSVVHEHVHGGVLGGAGKCSIRSSNGRVVVIGVVAVVVVVDDVAVGIVLVLVGGGVPLPVATGGGSGGGGVHDDLVACGIEAQSVLDPVMRFF